MTPRQLNIIIALIVIIVIGIILLCVCIDKKNYHNSYNNNTQANSNLGRYALSY